MQTLIKVTLNTKIILISRIWHHDLVWTMTSVDVVWTHKWYKVKTALVDINIHITASYLEITCVCYILLDNLDLQSCQVGQRKDVAINTPVQATLCTLSHQAVQRLASGLDSMWHTSTGGLWSRKISLWVQIARQCFQRSTWSVLPRVRISWSLNTLHLNIISKLFDRTTSQWNCWFLCRNSQLAPPTRVIMRDLAVN